MPKNYEITKNVDWINKWKLFTPKAIGTGNSKDDVVKPIIAGPNTICTETYVVIGPFDNKEICHNVCSYINTKFFHFLLTLKKVTQDATSKVYSFIPIQDFTKEWSDKELYDKYNLTKNEITFIESMVKSEIGSY